MQKKVYSRIVFNAYKKHYSDIKTLEQLNQAKKAYYACFNDFGAYQGTIKKFLEIKESELKSNRLNGLIKPFEQVEPLSFNLKGLNDVKNKISKLDSVKLKYEFEGLFNLLSDKTNLIYNPLWIRQQIIKDLNKFKSLRFFKVGYISKSNLKSEYRHLAFKNDAKKEHSKLYFIKSGLYVLKTLHHDNLSLKVFYIGKKYKTLLKSSNNVKMTLKDDKFNLSCIDAYKTLNKKDNIKYYSYCNSNGLDRTNRQLLKSIRKSKRISRESLIDSLESRKSEIMEDIKDCSSLEVLYYELELEDIEKSLSDLKSHDEDNSLEDETFLNDYF